MFDLENEIHAWCRSIHHKGPNRTANIDELTDHLFCEIERLKIEGLSEKQAFIMATQRIGKTEELIKEHSKNRSAISMLFYLTKDYVIHRYEKWSDSMKPKKVVMLMIATSIFFAAAIIFSDYLLEGTQYNKMVMYLLIALWWVPIAFLSASCRESKQVAVKSIGK